MCFISFNSVLYVRHWYLLSFWLNGNAITSGSKVPYFFLRLYFICSMALLQYHGSAKWNVKAEKLTENLEHDTNSLVQRKYRGRRRRRRGEGRQQQREKNYIIKKAPSDSFVFFFFSPVFRFVQLPIKFSYIFCSFRLKHVRQQQHIFYLFRVYLFRFCWSSCWFMLLGLYVAASFQRHSHMVRFAHEFPKCLFCSFFDTFFSGSRSSFYFLLVSCSFRLLPEHTHTHRMLYVQFIFTFVYGNGIRQIFMVK